MKKKSKKQLAAEQEIVDALAREGIEITTRDYIEVDLKRRTGAVGVSILNPAFVLTEHGIAEALERQGITVTLRGYGGAGREVWFKI